MDIKVRTEDDGSVYICALNQAGEQRKVATLNGPNQEIVIGVDSVVSEDGLDFSEVSKVGEPPAEEPAGDDETDAEGDPAPDASKEQETPEEPGDEAPKAIDGLGIGRAVTYRSRTGDYDVPAVVTATVATLFGPGVESGNVPPLSGNACVHLTVFTPGKEDTGTDDPAIRTSPNRGGSYQEWDIGQASDPENPEPGSWRWPERV